MQNNHSNSTDLASPEVVPASVSVAADERNAEVGGSTVRRRLVRAAFGLGIVCVALVAWYQLIGPAASYRETRSRSIAKLAGATSIEELDKVTSGLGVHLRLSDGSWIAIRYWDSHALTNFYSCAVALCSDGSWYESDWHFCGTLRQYTDRTRTFTEAGADDSLTGTERTSVSSGSFAQEPARTLQRIERASSLNEAKGLLVSLRFTPLHTESHSALAGSSIAP